MTCSLRRSGPRASRPHRSPAGSLDPSIACDALRQRAPARVGTQALVHNPLRCTRAALRCSANATETMPSTRQTFPRSQSIPLLMMICKGFTPGAKAYACK